MSKRRQSTDIPRAELINMIARLRGNLHDLLGHMGEGDDAETRHSIASARLTMKQTTFDVAHVDESEAEVTFEKVQDILRRVVLGEHFTTAEIDAALRVGMP